MEYANHIYTSVKGTRRVQSVTAPVVGLSKVGQWLRALARGLINDHDVFSCEQHSGRRYLTSGIHGLSRDRIVLT